MCVVKAVHFVLVYSRDHTQSDQADGDSSICYANEMTIQYNTTLPSPIGSLGWADRRTRWEAACAHACSSGPGGGCGTRPESACEPPVSGRL
jgi:hypothetical protein